MESRKHLLKNRFKKFAINVAHFVLELPYNLVNRNYADQLSRSATSAAANYSAALRAKSDRDFLNKFKIVEEELDEVIFFLELVEAMNPVKKERIGELSQEGNELLAIMVAAINTLRKKNRKS